jgi:hypothetical protein
MLDVRRREFITLLGGAARVPMRSTGAEWPVVGMKAL